MLVPIDLERPISAW